MRPMNISPSQASRYYYEKDPIFINRSQWHGKLAKEFKLDGIVDRIHFSNIVSGNDLNGNQIIKDGRDKKGHAYHRAGIDIPFSCPKSVSIVALHLDDKRVSEAHEQAVIATLNYIEKKWIYARQKTQGEVNMIRTQKGLFALFTHSTSRANDPTLHTHALIMNMTLTDRVFRAAWNDSIFKNQRMITQIFQSELAYRVKKLGYNIEYNEDGKWEIAGVSKQWIEAFSKRSAEIKKEEAVLKKEGTFSNIKDILLRNIAVLKSRPDKNKEITESQLRKSWELQIPSKEIKLAIQQQKIKSELNRNMVDSKMDINAFIDLSIGAIHETEAAFSKEEVILNVLKLARGLDYSIDDIDKAFHQKICAGDIVYLTNQRKSNGVQTLFYTSKMMLQKEREIISLIDQGKACCQPLLSRENSLEYLRDHFNYFTKDQSETVQYILSSSDRFMVIQGSAGVGKTSALVAIKHILEAENNPISLYGIGFTGKSARELQSHSQIPSQTLTSFLQSHSKDTCNSIWIVDESSMVGSLQLNQLITKAIKENSRVILIGDGHQLQSINAGRLFKDIQELNVVHVHHLNENIRQTGNEPLKKVISHLKGYQTGRDPKGIDKLFDDLETHKQLIQIPDKETCCRVITEDYILQDGYHNTLVITPLNSDRELLNTYLRKALLEKQIVSKDEIDLQVRVPKSLIGTSRYFADNYTIGTKAFVERGNSTSTSSICLPVIEGQEIEIIGRDLTQNLLEVRTDRGEVGCLNPKDREIKLSIYQNSSKPFACGDRIIFLKNDKLLGVQNGLIGTLEKIDSTGNISVRMEHDDHIVTFTIQQYSYIDYGYVTTLHKAQGQTAKNVIFMANSSHERLNRSELLNVAITRPQHQFKLYTDNITQLKEQFSIAQDKTSTLTIANTFKSIQLERGIR
ncbi:MAG: relaxase domain-containing protein [Desulfobacterales bacterium]|nr:relaxase domain-containing protein [Desulfobacterales bacterium]